MKVQYSPSQQPSVLKAQKFGDQNSKSNSLKFGDGGVCSCPCTCACACAALPVGLIAGLGLLVFKGVKGGGKGLVNGGKSLLNKAKGVFK